jgi:hypothetical protein
MTRIPTTANPRRDFTRWNSLLPLTLAAAMLSVLAFAGCGSADTPPNASKEKAPGNNTQREEPSKPAPPVAQEVKPAPTAVQPVSPDSDGDGIPDDSDGCPNDPLKAAPGICGCGVFDADSDGDGTPDCIDGCPLDPLKIAPGLRGCGVSDS